MVLLFTNYYKYAQYSQSNVKIQVQVQIHTSIKQQEENSVRRERELGSFHIVPSVCE